MSDSGQKFIGRNRAPRVQIEYDLETGGAQKKISLPFIMGVMSDLKGDYADDETPTAINDRNFEEVSSATFDKYLKEMKPRAKFTVENKLAPGEPDLAVDLQFESMKDFTPERIAQKVGPLKELLDARNQLKNLMSYMDGKPDAEKRIQELLANPTLLESLAASSKDEAEGGEEPKE